MRPAARVHPAFLGVVIASLLVPAYIGFRLPNYWSATLTLVNMPDGFFRRTLVGTVFAPVWSLVDYAYPAFALLSIAVLIAVLVVIALAAGRAQSEAQRLVVLVWILAPTGAYLFHIIGYLDLVLYLVLFLAIWLADRQHLVPASAAMTVSALVHENMLLVTLPVFAFQVLQSRGLRRMVASCVAPATAVAAIMLLPQVSTAKREIALATWDSAVDFPMRYDAINLQARSLTDAWGLYSVWDVCMWVIPIAAGIVAGWGLLIMARRRTTGGSVGLGICALVASLAPLALAFLGWDASRWNFLALSNFALIAFAWLGAPPTRLSLPVTLGVLVPFLPLFYQPLAYFDDASPRPIAPQVVVQYLRGEIPDGFLALPKA